MTKKKDMTIEDLAGMVKRGFDDADKRFDIVDKRFDQVNDRLDTIEKLVLAEHKHRIQRLEVEVKSLKDLFALK